MPPRQGISAGTALPGTRCWGEATERAAAQRRLLIEGLVTTLIILLLQAAFGTWRLSFLLFLTLPTALVGGVLAAWARWAPEAGRRGAVRAGACAPRRQRAALPRS